MRGRREIKYIGIANVQIKNFVTLLFDLIRQANQVADGIAQVIEALGRGDFAGLGKWHM